jgi:hypothetical protein
MKVLDSFTDASFGDVAELLMGKQIAAQRRSLQDQRIILARNANLRQVRLA